MVVTNLFRDQLDRYLEPEYVRSLMERSLRGLPAGTTLVLNADDPRLAHLAPELPNPRLYFGVADTSAGRSAADPTSDCPRCPRCGGELRYRLRLLRPPGPLGLRRAAAWPGRSPQVEATKIDLLGPGSSRLQVTTTSARAELASETVLDVPLPGLYNAYNALAAAAAAAACGLPGRTAAAIERVTAGCLRMERVAVPGHDVYLALAKNANGYTEVLRALLGRRPAALAGAGPERLRGQAARPVLDLGRRLRRRCAGWCPSPRPPATGPPTWPSG